MLYRHKITAKSVQPRKDGKTSYENRLRNIKNTRFQALRLQHLQRRVRIQVR